MLYILPLVAVILLACPLVPIYTGRIKGKKVRYAVLFNLFGFFGVCAVSLIFNIGGFVQAATEAVSAASTASADNGMRFIAAAVATGLSSLGAGIAVAAAAPAAIGAFSEDPKAFGKSLIFVGLGESVALYGLLISVLILSN
ncbi:MAG: ATP synthase subunit C [Oscillospiraceae bacterium]|nr:ATP synthase subunit C [Oscillospiraceae bacterium]